MVARKRGRAEVEADEGEKPQAPGLLTRLRNAWVFANVMQFIWIFGSAFKIDEDFDIEDLEVECLNPQPHYKLAEIGLCLLKAISSQRGMTSVDFDEYTSRQYKRRVPDGPNPFGEEETPNRFLDFDVFTQLRVLHQLALWTLAKPAELRERMSRKEDDPQTDWRIDPIGWDRDDRVYFLLDDSRLYRRIDPPIGTVFPQPMPKAAPPKPKSKPKPKAPVKPARQGTRTSKRLKVSEEKATTPEVEEEEEEVKEEDEDDQPVAADSISEGDQDLGGGYRWECVAITLQEYQSFLERLKKSRDPNEKNLYSHITEEVLPMLEKFEESRQRKIARRERELLALEKLATAKRSSRIAGKAEKEREDAERAAAEVKRQRDLAAARADEDRKRQMEEARESRMMTREQRLKEREYKRILHEEELANMSEDSRKLEQGEYKGSERRLKADIARKQKELEEIQQLEEDWVFDCAGCGVYGENMDDGTPIISCERCNVWQHLSCLGISQDEASKDDFHFVCEDCHRREREAKQKEEDAKKPKLPPLKFKYDPSAPATANEEAPAKRKRGRPRKHPLADGETPPPAKKKKTTPEEGEHLPGLPQMKMFKPPPQPNSMHHTFMNGPTLSPQGQFNSTTMNGHQQHPPPGLMSPPRGTFIPYDPRVDGYTPTRHTWQNHRPPPAPPQPTHGHGNTFSASVANGTGSGKSATGAGPSSTAQQQQQQQQTPSHPRQYHQPSTPAALASPSPLANGSLPHKPASGPVAPALSPPDQKKLSPAAAPGPAPGYSPVKPPPSSPALPGNSGNGISSSPAVTAPPPLAAPAAAHQDAAKGGLSPQKKHSPNPPRAPPLAPVNTAAAAVGSSGFAWSAPSPATQLPSATFGSARPQLPVFSRQAAPPPHPPSQPPSQQHALSTSPLTATTTTTTTTSSSNVIPPPVPAPQKKAADSSPSAPATSSPPVPKHLPAPPPGLGAPASHAAPLPAPVQAPTKKQQSPEAPAASRADPVAMTSPLAHSDKTTLPPPPPHPSLPSLSQLSSESQQQQQQQQQQQAPPSSPTKQKTGPE